MRTPKRKYRIEHDSMGEIEVATDKYWGAQTERSRNNFKVGGEIMPRELIDAFAILKSSAAKANSLLDPKKMTEKKLFVIEKVCSEILSGELYDHFPLVVWQTGSGTQTNMNLNEVIANRGNEILGEKALHPNDDVNMSQSSNDTFPTAMNIAAISEITKKLLPAIDVMIEELSRLEKENKGIIKVGRTHLQDAVPISFSQEISSWRAALESSRSQIENAIKALYPLAIGGTAVGTGLNAPAGFDKLVAQNIAESTKIDFTSAENKFHALSFKDVFVFAHGALKSLAANLLKIANDIRWLASGPRCGLGEIKIPENEPGSSIMPGKVNPTQCEMVSMVAIEVMGNDAAISFAASQGNFELNVYMPLIAFNFLRSVRLLTDAMISFSNNCLSGLVPDREKMRENLEKSLMNVTALNKRIGYENAAKIAQTAHRENITLKESALGLGLLTEEEFDRLVVPEKMV